MTTIERISRELTTGNNEWLRTRRKIAALAGAVAADFALIGMRQYGVIRRLPDVPLRGFDANRVTTSPNAYPFGIPDSSLAVVGLGGIIALATAGGSARTGRPGWLDHALVGATVIGAGVATYFVDMMARRERRACVYCLAGATGFFAMTALAIRGFLRR